MKLWKKILLGFACAWGVAVSVLLIVLGIKALHVHNWELSNVSPALCERIGVATYTCSCGELQERVSPQLGHEIWTYEGKAPDCTSMGWKNYEKCTRRVQNSQCGYSTYEVLPALGHTFDKEGNCIRCKLSQTEKVEQEHIHEYIEEVISIAPTCQQTGVAKFSCQCGQFYRVKMPVVGHRYRNNVCVYCNQTKAPSSQESEDAEDSNSESSSNSSGTESEADEGYITEKYFDEDTQREEVALVGYDESKTELIIPNGVTVLIEGVFKNGITKIDTGSTVRVIKENTFEKLTTLKEVVIGEGVEVIQVKSFNEMTCVESVVFKKTAEWIACEKDEDGNVLDSFAVNGRKLVDEKVAAEYLTNMNSLHPYWQYEWLWREPDLE